MNLAATLAVVILITINVVVGILMSFQKIKLVRVRPEAKQTPPEPEQPLISEVTVPDMPRRKPGRPRKFTSKRKVRHLHLPPSITQEQLGDVAEFFQKHKTDDGDRIILHVPSAYGPERDVEVPYPVRWNDTVKNDFSTVLGGWS